MKPAQIFAAAVVLAVIAIALGLLADADSVAVPLAKMAGSAAVILGIIGLVLRDQPPAR